MGGRQSEPARGKGSQNLRTPDRGVLFFCCTYSITRTVTRIELATRVELATSVELVPRIELETPYPKSPVPNIVLTKVCCGVPAL